jgi:hypothetical protein
MEVGPRVAGAVAAATTDDPHAGVSPKIDGS